MNDQIYAMPVDIEGSVSPFKNKVWDFLPDRDAYFVIYELSQPILKGDVLTRYVASGLVRTDNNIYGLYAYALGEDEVTRLSSLSRPRLSMSDCTLIASSQSVLGADFEGKCGTYTGDGLMFLMPNIMPFANADNDTNNKKFNEAKRRFERLMTQQPLRKRPAVDFMAGLETDDV